MHQLLKTRVLLCLTVISGIVSRLPAVVVAASQDEAAIRAAAKEYLTAMHAGDVDALRKMWTPDGDYVDASGNRFKSREFFSQRATGDAAKSAPAELPPAKSSLRFISPDVAIEDGTNDFAVSPDGEKMTGRFTAVWVKRDGRWLLDSLREATTVEHALNEHLRPLEWLLGEWAGVSKDANILVSSHESDRGQYIVREFLIRREGCPRGLEDLLKDMEDRLAVLLSPEAEDAREWLSHLFATARNPEALLGRRRPDVLSLTASQIRQELRWLDQHRSQRERSQTAFDRGRSARVQSAQGAHASTQRAWQDPQIRGVQPPNSADFRSQYSPHREFQQTPLPRPTYAIGPGGDLIMFHPMHRN